MKIGIVCHSGCGGSARIATGIAEQLAENGHVVHLFSRFRPYFRINGEHPQLFLHTLQGSQRDESRVYRVPIDWSKDDIFALRSLICEVAENEQLDIIHMHYALPFAFLAEMIRAQLGDRCPRLVCTLHGTDVSVYARDPSRGALLRLALWNFDVITTVSDNLADLALAGLKLRRRPSVIHNFIDMSVFRPVPRRKRNFPPRIVHISDFGPSKDTMSAARIFVRVREQFPVQLCLIGEGPDAQTVMDYLDKERLAADTWLFGCMRDPSDVIRRADLMLITSVREAFGLQALEAMGCGLPVVSTRIGGIPEVVMDGVTGFLYTQGEEDTAVKMVSRLLTDWRLYDRMSQISHKWSTGFDKNKIVNRYETLYYGLTGKSWGK
jgi:N-acetyl-alpha-D-glucosaminyl L-malate synthase BshA